MIAFDYISSKVSEQYNSNQEIEDIDSAFLHFVFPFLEQVDLDLLNDCNEQIPAKNIKVSGYYCNVDENYINIYVSIYNQFAKSGQSILEKEFEGTKSGLDNLIKMIDDNSYREINESRPLYDLCDYIVSHIDMEIILNIVTNYVVPKGYILDGNYKIGIRSIGLRTFDVNDLANKISATFTNTNTLNLLEKFGKGTSAVLISSDNDIDVYLTSFSGEWLAQLYKEDSIGLLSANVRSYLKRTNKVNKEIIETVKESPQEFVAYNNGLSAIATGIQIDNNVIESLTDFLIVNGGQTTATLYECKNDRLDLSKIIVPAKIAIIKNIESSEYLVSNISIFSNSQTAIKRSDPPSNSKFFKTYEDISKTVMARKNMQDYHCFFERTNGQYNTLKKIHTKKSDSFLLLNPEKFKFSKLQLAQAIISWQQMPDLVCKGQEKCFEYFYSIVKDFSTQIVDENYFKGSYALIIVYRKFDQIIKKLKLQYKSSLIAYTMSYLSLISKKCADLIEIWNNQATGHEFEQMLTIMVQDVYEKLIDSPSNYSDIRMWSRKSECWDHVKTIVKKYELPENEKEWEFLPENAAKTYIENNLKNSKMWINLEKWIQINSKSFTESQIYMIHGMPAVIYKHDKGMRKMTRKQETFAKSIFLAAVEQGFKFE